MFDRAKILYCYYLCWTFALLHLLNQWKFCSANFQETKKHLWLSPFLTKLQAATLLHRKWLMSKFSEILILACRAIFSTFFIWFCMELFPNSCDFPPKKLWLQFVFSEKISQRIIISIVHSLVAFSYYYTYIQICQSDHINSNLWKCVEGILKNTVGTREKFQMRVNTMKIIWRLGETQ